MGPGRDPGQRPSQAGGHIRQGNADPDHRKIDIYRQNRAEMATERYRFVSAARNARLEKRADGAGVVGQTERATRFR